MAIGSWKAQSIQESGAERSTGEQGVKGELATTVLLSQNADTFLLQVQIPEEFLEIPPESDFPKTSFDDVNKPKIGMKSLFATRKVSRITVIMWLQWMIVTMSYYGISLGVGDLGSDLFVNFILVCNIMHQQVQLICHHFDQFTLLPEQSD